MRRAIARRLLEAYRTVPTYDLTLDVEIDALLAARDAAGSDPGAGKLSVTDFLVKAVALALRQVPEVNAVWTEEALELLPSADVAVAVATPGGLVTQVVASADAKDLSTIAAELRDLTSRARAGRVRPEEYQGGSITVSNLGMYGVRQFAPIINPPQCAILAVGAAEPRPVVRDGAVVIRTLLSCTLTADHRAVDGAVGARFLAAVKAHLEAPARLLAGEEGARSVGARMGSPR
jgi:pyruvate dehydrogenase E2 component (dihydrolipoamide acetyltransferase)